MNQTTDIGIIANVQMQERVFNDIQVKKEKVVYDIEFEEQLYAHDIKVEGDQVVNNVKLEEEVVDKIQVKKELMVDDIQVKNKPAVDDTQIKEDQVVNNVHVKEEQNFDHIQIENEKFDDVQIDELLVNDIKFKEDLDVGPTVFQARGIVTTPTQANRLLPKESKKKYEYHYKLFMDWRATKNTTSLSENVLLAYFQELANKYKSSTLWAEYSMLKTTLKIKHQINISRYDALHAFLKRKSEGYQPKKSNTFSPEQINKFLNEAPNQTYLLTKIVLIFGIMGGCRRQELHELLSTDVQDLQSRLLVKIVNTKTKTERSFTITGKHYELCKDYIKLRPSASKNPSFFLSYRSGKCTSQSIGINKIGGLGKTIAKYLNLSNPELYTGHCFRRTSAALLGDTGGRRTAVKMYGGWKSTAAAEEHIIDPIQKQTQTREGQVVDNIQVIEELAVDDVLMKEEQIVENIHAKEEQDFDDMQIKNEKDDDIQSKEPKRELDFCPTVVQTRNIVFTPTKADGLLPVESKKKYEHHYKLFMDWRATKNTTSLSEYVLLAYFQELSSKFKSSTLWAEYSMLKTTLKIKHQIDISMYDALHAFLKRKSEGYQPKKSNTFSPEQINKFLNEAPNQTYLLTKIVLIFGIMGACRRQELHELLFIDVQDLQSRLLVKIVNPKTKTERSFTITGKHYELCKAYINLRPSACKNPSFFLSYRSGKCTSQSIGINNIGGLGKTIAKYLNLSNPELYTGHCFRRTSAALLVDAGSHITTLKIHGGWKSTTAADGYVIDPIKIQVREGQVVNNIQVIEEIPVDDIQIKGEQIVNNVQVKEQDQVKEQVTCNNIDIHVKEKHDFDHMKIKNEKDDNIQIEEELLMNDIKLEGELDLCPTVVQTRNIVPTPTKAVETTNGSLPQKSKWRYEKHYKLFMNWRAIKNTTSFSENVLLAYFQELSNKFKSSTLWAEYSMLKTTLKIKHQIDISKYAALHAFLKRKSIGYGRIKTNINTFSPEQVNTFLNDAPDETYLLTKIVLIFAIMGACRIPELYELQFSNVQDLQSRLLVKIVNTNTKTKRSFTITGKLYELCKNYISLRPNACNNPSFFLIYKSGKCTSQSIGIDKIGGLGKTIAKYLNLSNPHFYTGHCFHRTSAALLVDAGGDITTPKKHGGFKSTAAAEGYIIDHTGKKIQAREGQVVDKIQVIEEIAVEDIQIKEEQVVNNVQVKEQVRVQEQVTFDNIDIHAKEKHDFHHIQIKNENNDHIQIEEELLMNDIKLEGELDFCPTVVQTRNIVPTPTKAITTTNDLLPQISKKKYEKHYKIFMDWRATKNTTSLSENILLAYFQEISNKFKSSTLWTEYSMLKTTLKINHDVDISKYAALHALLKRKSEGYERKKSNTFSLEQINIFLNEAPDQTYLLAKVVLIFGIKGACGRQQLHELLFTNVQDLQSRLLVKIVNTNTKTERSFTITGKHYELCKEYIKLRPSACRNPSFFLIYKSGKCTSQSVGINKIGAVGKTIAKYLNLSNPELYTGTYCLRRISPVLLVDAGGIITNTRKRRGSWKSTAATEQNTDDPIKKKIIASNDLLKLVETKTINEIKFNTPSTSTKITNEKSVPIQNFTNCSIRNINYYNLQ